MRRHALLLCLGVGCVAGCNPELGLFERIEVGKPPPANRILKATTAPSAQEWATMSSSADFAWHVPSIAAAKQVEILLDRDGRVVAKCYEELAFSHWLVVQSGSRKWVVEAQVPADCYREPPAGWGGSPMDDNGRLLPDANHVMGYMDFVWQKTATNPLGKAPFNRRDLLAVNYFLFMYASTWMYWREDANDFRGVTREGFDRRIDFRNAGKARIRNLGGRIIRIEHTSFGLLEALPLCPITVAEERRAYTDAPLPRKESADRQ
jgi:hypothetical protein